MGDGIARRGLLTAGAAAPLLVAAAEPQPRPVRGEGLTPAAASNPLEVRVAAFTTVTADYKASVAFYRDVMGFELAGEGPLASAASTAPGTSALGPRHALLQAPGPSSGGAVRVLEVAPGARANRPRPGARIFDPGLAVMEVRTGDAAESYRLLRNAGTPMVSSPRYYAFRATTLPRDLDVMSYSPFGPGGEQMFITANVRSDRARWALPGVHASFHSTVIVSLDQRPVDAFYRQAFGLLRVNELDCYQANVAELTGAPADNYFLWGFLGQGVTIEVEEHRQPSGVVYPTSLDRTGLAMITLEVADLERCRALCREAGIAPVGEGALPLPGRPRPAGFTLRGAVGELVEVVGRS